MNLKTILAFIKKNWKYTVFVLAILFLGLRSCVRDRIITKQAKEIAQLELLNYTVNDDRQALKLQLKKLQNEYDKISGSNDSMKLVLNAKQKELKDLIAKYKKEIDSLLNIPDDSIFVRLQPIYPNYDNSPLIYPFSASQIRPIYGTALEYPRLEKQYSLQGKTLKTCLDLNDGFEKETANLNSQISNLQDNIGKADKQIENYKGEIKILDKQVSSNKFWKKTLLIVAGITTGIAILK
jgi:peptidoglycan hydrolase CwlO-like protein